MTQDIQLKYFFLPMRLQVQSNPGGENVIILKPTILGTFEFIRLPVDVAHQFASLLELAANNAEATPVISGEIGEISGNSVRRLGTAEIRIRLSVKRSNSIRFGIRQTVQGIGSKTHHSTPTISVVEARKFANIVREAS